MLPFLESLVQQITPNVVLDIAITAIFIYAVFAMIRGTRAVTLVAGVSVLLGIYAVAQLLSLRLFTQILQAGAFLGVFALVVVFQPELRRALERLGRVGMLGWLLGPHEEGTAAHVAHEVARASAILSREGVGALVVLERGTGLEEIAETGIAVNATVSDELLRTIFTPRTPLHDGAVIIRQDTIIAAGALLPLSEIQLSERFGTRHRAALGITEDTDAVAVVISEESGQMSVVERARFVRVPTEEHLERALAVLLEPLETVGHNRRRAVFRLPIADRLRLGQRHAADTPAAGSGTPGSDDPGAAAAGAPQ